MLSFGDEIARCLVAVWFLYAGISKLAAPDALRSTLLALRVPHPGLSAIAVPALEVMAAVFLLAAPRLLLTLVLLGMLVVGFVGAAASALIRGVKVRCACLGRASEGELGWSQLGMAPIWTLVGVWAYFASTSLQGRVGLISAAAMSLVIAVIALRQLLPLWQESRVIVGAAGQERRFW